MAHRKLSAKEFSRDVRAGLSDEQLMDKYKLTSLGMRKALTKLLDAEVLEPDEITGRLPLFQSSVAIEGVRLHSRNFLLFPVPVFEAQNILAEGVILDITEQGLKTLGIPAHVGETKTLAIRADEFHDIYPFVFDAVCQWTETGRGDEGPTAGFEITDITQTGRRELDKLIRLLTFAED